jgi:hypothetical protein
MEIITSQWVEATKNAITTLQQKYSNNRGMLLTEGDLECHLFSELLNQPCLSGFHLSKNVSCCKGKKIKKNLKTTYVHSQVTWFNTQRQSGYEVDLTICDPEKLEVHKIEIFEEYPHKGFAYDGPCVAIELKFMRDGSNTRQYDEDYLGLRDGLIPDKIANIESGRYKLSNKNNIAFVTIVGCKRKQEYEKAILCLGKHLSDKAKPCPDNLFVCVFYQDQIIWDNEALKRVYQAKAEELKNNT